MTDEPKKERPDSILAPLPEDKRMELRDGMLAGWSHDQCRSFLRTECGITFGSNSVLTRFYKRHCAPVVRENRRLAAVKSEIYVNEAGRTDWNAATMELVKQVSFEMLSGQQTDPKVAEKFVKLILKADSQDQSRDKAKEAARSKVDAGMEAMFAEIKGNKAAETAFRQLQEAIGKS